MTIREFIINLCELIVMIIITILFAFYEDINYFEFAVLFFLFIISSKIKR